jgi:hypothetical protein
MRIGLGRLSAITVLVAALGLMGALAASASTESFECRFTGEVRLMPGLTEQPEVQRIHVIGSVFGCGEPRANWEGELNAHLTTAEPVTCAALKGNGAANSASSSFKMAWARNGFGISAGSACR